MIPFFDLDLDRDLRLVEFDLFLLDSLLVSRSFKSVSSSPDSDVFLKFWIILIFVLDVICG